MIFQNRKLLKTISILIAVVMVLGILASAVVPYM